MMMLKIRLISYAVRLGFHAFYLDTDIAMLRDPIVHFLNPPYDIVFASDTRCLCGPHFYHSVLQLSILNVAVGVR
jgi:hypothetical protein